MRDTYKITILSVHGEERNTRYKGMTLEDADRTAGDICLNTDSNGIGAALRVIREIDGELYSEWEW